MRPLGSDRLCQDWQPSSRGVLLALMQQERVKGLHLLMESLLVYQWLLFTLLFRVILLLVGFSFLVVAVLLITINHSSPSALPKLLGLPIPLQLRLVLFLLFLVGGILAFGSESE